MNSVAIEQVERTVSVKRPSRTVDIELIRIESDYYYASPVQLVDEPKERE